LELLLCLDQLMPPLHRKKAFVDVVPHFFFAALWPKRDQVHYSDELQRYSMASIVLILALRLSTQAIGSVDSTREIASSERDDPLLAHPALAV
jgi:hypothetical protein